VRMSKKVIFCYDIVCPYAYIASRRIEAIAKSNDATLEWMPVLLGGLYKLDQAPQGKDGSASDVMSPTKKALGARDLRRTLERYQVPLSFHSNHPVRSVDCQRLLCAANTSNRPALSHALYHAYWVLNENIDEEEVLQKYAKQFGVEEKQYKNEETKKLLQNNTQWTFNRGAFGVPSMFVTNPHLNLKEELFWGQDRLHFVDQALGNPKPQQLRLAHKPLSPKLKAHFYYDFSSPWTFLAWTQINRIRELGEVELVPILLGALFKEVGTANVPMFTLTERKRAWGSTDIALWQKWWGESLRFPDTFPIRTVLPLRVAIVKPQLVDRLFRAAWQDNINIGDEKELKKLISKEGFDAESILKEANEPRVRDLLKDNTTRAKDSGVIGCPTFEINHDLIWGQDRLDVVADILCGWKPSEPPILSKI